MVAEVRLETHCLARKFRWWLQRVCQELWLWIEEERQERKPGEVWLKNNLHILKMWETRTYKCWEVSRVEKMEDMWEERADRTGSQERQQNMLLCATFHAWSWPREPFIWIHSSSQTPSITDVLKESVEPLFSILHCERLWQMRWIYFLVHISK